MINKFNWGHGITVFYIIFVGIVVTAFVASTKVDHTLVVDDYYAHDLAYQQKYNKISNHIASDQFGLKYNKNEKTITLDFKGTKGVSGTIHFYRPSNQSLDFVIPIEKNKERIPTNDIQEGLWKLKIDWKDNGVSYYTEETIYI